MVPNSYSFNEEMEEDSSVHPSRTYQIDWESHRVIGMVDGIDAVIQQIDKVLSTDKYAYVIYDWYYGNELYKLVGQPEDYVRTQIPDIIEEALLVDERIISVSDFEFTSTAVDSLLIQFTVTTIFGSVQYNNLEVTI